MLMYFIFNNKIHRSKIIFRSDIEEIVCRIFMKVSKNPSVNSYSSVITIEVYGVNNIVICTQSVYCIHVYS